MKVKILGVAVLSMMLAVFGFVAITGAQSFQTGQSSTIKSNEVIDGSAYIASSTIDVAGTVDGDLYCTGQNVSISGTINGDILCAAQTINFTGTASGNIRLAGQVVTVSGAVGDSATVASQTVTVENQGSIGRDATFMSQSVTIRGQVLRDVVVGSESMTLDATVGRNVTATVNNLKLESKTNVGGSFSYTSPQTFSKASGASIAGPVNYTELKQEQYVNNKVYNPFIMILWGLMLIVSAIIFALLFPGILHRVTREGVVSPTKALLAILIGFVGGVAMPIIIFLFFVTILGIPFAIVLLLGWCLIVAASGAFAAYFIGRLVWRKQENIVLATLIGALIIAVLLMIPIVNIFITILCVSYGSGALLMYLTNRLKSPKYNEPIVRQPDRKTV